MDDDDYFKYIYLLYIYISSNNNTVQLDINGILTNKHTGSSYYLFSYYFLI